MKNKASHNQKSTLLAFVMDSDSVEILNQIPFSEFNIKEKIIKGGSDAAYKYLKDHRSPTFLILDLSGNTLPISEVERISEVCEPSVTVIIIGDNNDVGVYRQLLALGVTDYLVKPIKTNLLTTRIKGALQKNNQEADPAGFSYRGQVISFLGVVGGVGASTITANCGLLLAEEYNRRVSLVDFDLTSAPIAHALDAPINGGLIDILKDPKRLDQTLLDKLIVPYGPHLDLLCSEADILTPYPHCAPGMKTLLELLTQHYNYTFIDCSHSAPATFQSLTFKISDKIILVCDLTFGSVSSTSRLVQYFQNNSNLEQELIIVANKSGQYASGELSKEDFEDAIQHPVSFIMPFEDKAPLKALNTAEPLIRENCPLTNSLKEFSAHLTGKPLKAKETSFFKKLFTTKL